MVVKVIDAPWARVPARFRWHNTTLDMPRNHLPDGDIPGPQREGVRSPGASGCAGDKNDSAQLSRQIRLARSGSYDVVTLASRDTDLAPALGEAHKLQAAKIEAAKWYDPSDSRTFGNIKTKARLWTTSMNRYHFMGSLAPLNYE